MSKTYKHQLKYDLKNWENPNKGQLVEKKYCTWSYQDGKFVKQPFTTRVVELEAEKDPDEPQWYGMPSRTGRMSDYWHTWSNRRCRRKAKQMIRQGKYVEAEMLKPENVDWMIW